MLKIKVDPKLPYHYIIGVAVHNAKSGTPGKLFLKYGPVCFTNEDLERVYDSIILSKDKIYRDIYEVTPNEIYKMNECSELLMSITGMQLAANVNQATLHHFSSEFEIPDPEKYFEWLVKTANKSESKERKKLDEARIKNHR